MTATVGLVAPPTEWVPTSSSTVCAVIMDSTTSLLEAVLAAISIPQNKRAASMQATSKLPRTVKRRGGDGSACPAKKFPKLGN